MRLAAAPVNALPAAEVALDIPRARVLTDGVSTPNCRRSPASHVHRRWRRRAVAGLAALALPVLAAAQAPGDTVRVPTSHANVHMGPNTTREVLVLAPKGTILEVLARDGEWLEVRLTLELRKTGMVVRWYKNEDRGWMHDSTVERVELKKN